MVQGRLCWFFLIIVILLLVNCSIFPPGQQVQSDQNSPAETTTPIVSGSQGTSILPSSVGINLGTPQQIFHFDHPDAMGMFNVPDMHIAVLQQPDMSYLLWITGNIGPSGGSIALLSTKDFIHYQNAGPGTQTKAEPVMTPSCPKSDPPCKQNYDADYVGANSFIAASNGKDLLMFYEVGNKTVGTDKPGGWEYNVMALARSSDNGRIWMRQGVVLSGPDPKPDSVGTSQPDISEPGVLVANGYIYMVFQYVPNRESEPEAPSVIQVARALVGSDGAPGTWVKYYNGAWGEPGLGGRGTTIVVTGEGIGCTRPVQVWPVFSSYLNAYVLTFLCNEGWFFSTSADLVTWTRPVNFMPMQMWRSCQPMDWNFIFVTPGKPGGVIDQTGYVLYAHTDHKGLNCDKFSPHELWARPFTFTGGL